MKILITGGPTNEYIDEVMKITNMSSGKIATELAEYFVSEFHDMTLLLTKSVKYTFTCPKMKIIRFETTDELFNAIKEEAKNELDQVKHLRKFTMSKSEHDYYSVCVDVSKIAIDSRTDIPKQRVYIPHQDIFGRVFYVQKFIW